MTKTYFQVISPDGIEIMPDLEHETREPAVQEYVQWTKRFERQGYYSSNRGRIDLQDLHSFCKMGEYRYNEIEDEYELVKTTRITKPEIKLALSAGFS